MMTFPWMLSSRHCRGNGAYQYLMPISNSCPSWTIHFLTALTVKFTSSLNATEEYRGWRANDSNVMRKAFPLLFYGQGFTQFESFWAKMVSLPEYWSTENIKKSFVPLQKKRKSISWYFGWQSKAALMASGTMYNKYLFFLCAYLLR